MKDLKTINDCITQIEKTEYECEAVYLKNDIAFIAIKKIAKTKNLTPCVMPSLPEIDFLMLRKEKRLTLRDVEKSTGISNAYLSQLERGKIKSPGYNTVKSLCELCINEA